MPDEMLDNKRNLKVTRLLLGAFALVIVLATAAFITERYSNSTDDAYVAADTVTVAPKVTAYVAKLYVSDNSRFNKGQILVELDPRDFEVALKAAMAASQAAEAKHLNVESRLKEQASVEAEARAELLGDQAALGFAQQQVNRYEALSKDGSGTKERFQAATADVLQHISTVARDQAAYEAAKEHANVLQSELAQSDAEIAQSRAQSAQAALNLSYTKIYAPFDGTVANRTVQTGNYVEPGQSLFAAVPNHLYVVANFKETQLRRVHSGTPVTVSVDALGGKKLHGVVDSVQQGTGSNFALLPPENATGNFVKVVQRVPVKILINENENTHEILAPGMSVVVYLGK